MTEIESQSCYKPGGVREFLRLAFPLILSNASMTIMHFVDRIFLSWSSSEDIAASLPAGILVFTVLAFFLGVCEYTNTFVAQFYGAKRRRDISSAVWQGVIFSIIGGVVCFALLPIGLILLNWGGHSPAILAKEKIYFTFLMSGGFFFLFKEALSAFFTGRGKTKVILYVNVIANIINAVLDYGLIFGYWGFPEWGIKGAAIATVASTVFACVVLLILYLSPPNRHAYQTYATMKLNFNLMKRLLRFGTPSGVQFFLDISSFTVFIFLIGRLGNVELAASNIVLSINHLAWFPMIGAGVATATMVGQHLGRKNSAIAEKSAYSAFFAIEIYMLMFAAAYWLFPDFLLGLFYSSESEGAIPFSEVKRTGVVLLMLIAFFQCADGMIIAFSGALRGAGDTKFAMWAGVVCAWLFFVPGTWVLVEVFHAGIIYVWIWASIYIGMLGIVMLCRFRSGVWKKIDLIGSE